MASVFPQGWLLRVRPGQCSMHLPVLRKNHGISEENCGQKSGSVSMVLFTR